MSRRLVLGAFVVLVIGALAALFVPAVGSRLGIGDPGDETAEMPAAGVSPPAAPELSPPRGEVVIDSRRQQLMGVRTAPVRRTSLSQEVRVPGVVRFDETRQAEISSKVDGWIRDLRANATGRAVAVDEILFTLYSPGLLAAQNEYLLAMRGQTQAAGSEVASVREYADRLRAAARERLLRWDLSEADIRGLEERGQATDTVPFRSPVAGTIVEKVAVEGMRVTAGQTLFRIADLSAVWIEAAIPAHDLGVVRVGQPASLVLDGFPGEPLTGRTAYIYPTVDETTRTARVRFQFPNRGGRLRPGMFATVEIATPQAEGLTVPVDAVLEGGRDSLVFVALGEGRFEPRRVEIGRRGRDEIEITSGLREAEHVATGAAFLIDSESQLRAAVQSFQGAPAPGGEAAAPAGERLDISFRAQPDPPRAGENAFEVVLRDAAGRPVSDANVSATFFMPAMPSMNMPAMRNQVSLPAAGAGVYRGSGQVVMAGRWDVTVDVMRGGERLGSRQFTVVAR